MEKEQAGLSALKAALQQSVADGRVAVRKGWFDSVDLAPFFDKVLKADSITIVLADAAKAIVDDAHFVMQGSAELPLLGEMTCTMKVTATDSKALVVFDASLGGQCYPETIFSWLDSSLLRGISCSSYGLSFSSDAPDVIKLSCNLAEPATSSIDLTISLKSESCSLAYRRSKSLAIPGIETMELRDVSGELEYREDTDFSGNFKATFAVGSLSIPVTLPIPSGRSETVIKYTNDRNEVLDGINELLAALTEGDKLSQSLAPIDSIIKQSGITLSGMEIGLNSQSLMPQRFSVRLGFLKSWNLTDAVSVADPQLAFSYRRDYLSDINPFDAELSARITLGSTDLMVGASLPDTTIFCYLAAGQKVSCADITNCFGLNFKGLPDIALTDVRFAAGIAGPPISLAAGFSSDLSFDLGGTDFRLTKTAFQMNYAEGKCAGTISGAFDIDDVGFSVSASTDADGWQFQARAEDNIKLASMVSSLLAKAGITVDACLPPIDLEATTVEWNTGSGTYAIAAKISSGSDIDFGVTSLALKGMDLDIKRIQGKATGTIKGTVDIGPMSFAVNYDLSKGPIISADLGTVNISQMAQTFCGRNLLGEIGLPHGFPDFKLDDCKIDISAADKSAVVTAGLAGYGRSAFELKKGDSGWGFVFAAVIGPEFRFENFLSALKPIDALNFQSSALVVSTMDVENFAFGAAPGLSGKVSKGLNFLMSLSMRDRAELMKIKQILNLQIDALKVHMAVGADGSALLEGLFDGSFSLIKGITLTESGLRVSLQTGNIIFGLFVKVAVDIGDKLLFTGAMEVQPNGAFLAATMQGDWNKPFGVQGLKLSDVALLVGISAEAIPTVGIAGHVQVQDFDGELAVLFNSQAPQQSALKLAFNEFCIKTVLELCDKSIMGAIPNELHVVLDLGYKDVEIYVVPATTRIGELKYEQGFRAKGSVDILGWDAMTDMEIDPSKGITAVGRMDSLNLLDVFTLQGSGDKIDPEFQLALRLDEQKAIIAGAVSFLGLNKYAVFADISSGGAVFSISQKIYGVIQLALEDCCLNKSGFSASGKIIFGIGSLGPIKVAGVTILNKININTKLSMGASLDIKDSFSMTLKGSLTVLGYSLPSIQLSFDVAPKDFEEVLSQLIDIIKSLIADHFKHIWRTVEEWANAVKDGLVDFTGDVASVAKGAFNATEDAAVAAYKILDKGIDEIAQGLKDAYQLGDKAVTTVLKGAGYAANEVAGALKSVYGLGDQAVTTVLKGAGYTANEVAYALKSVYGLGDKAVTTVLKGAGYAANEVAGALKSVYGLADSAAAKVLKGAGYAAGEVGDALESAYNISVEAAGKVLEGAGYAADEIKKWGGDAIDWMKDTGGKIVDWFKSW
jgi:hypothetical protein